MTAHYAPRPIPLAYRLLRPVVRRVLGGIYR